MRTARLVLTAAALLAIAAPARATTLYTPPLSSPTPGTCTALNVGTKPLEVTIEVADASGHVSAVANTTLAPSTVANLSPGATFSSTIGYCRFTFKGSKNNVRAGYFQNGPGPAFLLQTVVRAE